jgi:hypothetical protein
VEWRQGGLSRIKKSRVKKSAGKSLASIIWDQGGILLIDYLPKCQNINAENYPSLLVQLKDILKEKLRRNFTKCLVLARQRPFSQTTCNSEGTTWASISDHTPYSQDLVPSEFNLFPGLKEQLNVHHFWYDAEVIAAAQTRLD